MYCCIVLLLVSYSCCVTLLLYRPSAVFCGCHVLLFRASAACVSTFCCVTHCCITPSAVYHPSAVFLLYHVLLYHSYCMTVLLHLVLFFLSLASALPAAVSCSDVMCLSVMRYIALCVSYLCVSLLRAWSRRRRSTTFSTSFSLSEVTNQEPETRNL
jgi:hypothetical protein